MSFQVSKEGIESLTVTVNRTKHEFYPVLTYMAMFGALGGWWAIRSRVPPGRSSFSGGYSLHGRGKRRILDLLASQVGRVCR